MSHVALYRKFRPQIFADVKGQEPIVRTLKNQIKNQRIGHAYLFTGTRGTGKTSVAKILAKAVNCLSPQDGEPCGVCENCVAAANGTLMDIVEIDAASNTGVEDIRRVIEEIQYTPARGKYKVYIIDEVHMLSMNAFNAFLKTLEEPPSYVVFILATTEPHKLPATILSRCQRYDFKRIHTEEIMHNLSGLLEKEGKKAEEKALRYIAGAGDGSMRDALSLLDRCIAFSTDDVMTYEEVLSILGSVDTQDFSALYRAVGGFDVVAALQIIEKTVQAGRDLSPFVSDFLFYLRNLLILHAAGKSGEDLLGLSEENFALLEADAKGADEQALMRYIRILSELLNQIRFSASKQILTEVAIIKLATPQMETDTTALSERVRALEEVVASGVFAQPANAQGKDVPTQSIAYAEAEQAAAWDIIDISQEEFAYVPFEAEEDFAMAEESCGTEDKVIEAESKAAKSEPGSAARVCASFDKVLAACEDRRLKVFLSKAETAAENDTLILYTSGEIAYKQLSEPEALSYIKRLISEQCGIFVQLAVRRIEDKPEVAQQTDLQALLKNINMNVETEDI